MVIGDAFKREIANQLAEKINCATPFHIDARDIRVQWVAACICQDCETEHMCTWILFFYQDGMFQANVEPDFFTNCDAGLGGINTVDQLIRRWR